MPIKKTRRDFVWETGGGFSFEPFCYPCTSAIYSVECAKVTASGLVSTIPVIAEETRQRYAEGLGVSDQ